MQMNHSLIVKQSVEINTSVDRVWETMTNPELIKVYLFGTNTRTDWKEGSEIVFEGEFGEIKYRDVGTILEIIPFKKIRYTYWSGFSGLPQLPENDSEVEYQIEAAGDKSIFTWIQKGFPDEERQAHSREGMPALLKQIKEVAEG
jgi:uncharacterized protein YndB with AHSA1/START domain